MYVTVTTRSVFRVGHFGRVRVDLLPEMEYSRANIHDIFDFIAMFTIVDARNAVLADKKKSDTKRRR